MREFPSGHYDFCILGESLINFYMAACLSNQGHKVIVIVRENINETDSSTFNFSQLLDFITSKNKHDNFFNFHLYPKINDFKDKNSSLDIEAAALAANDSNQVTTETLLCLSKKFFIDLNPLIIFSNGPTINSIVDFNITHHIGVVTPTSFKMYWSDSGKFEVLPLNRNDIFVSNFLSLIEKHTLTKFVNKCLQASINEADEMCDDDMLVEQFLDENRLTLKLKTILNYSLMNDWFSSPSSPKNLTKKYFFEKFNNNLQSVKRFNTNSKYLLSSKGNIDLIHCYLRKASIMGAITCYGMPVIKIEYEYPEKFHKISFEEDKYVTASTIIADRCFGSLFDDKKDQNKENLRNVLFISHCVLITTDSSDSNMHKSKESLFNLEFIVLPGSEKDNNDTFVIKHGSGSSCPIGLNLIHFTKHQLHEDVKKDLSQAVDFYKEACSIKIIWECYFTSKHSKDDSAFIDLSNTHEKVFITNSLVGWCISDDFLNAADKILTKISRKL